MEVRCHVTHKKQYKDYDDAYNAKVRFENDYGEEMEAYECEYCHKWHIGHKSIGDKNGARAR